tara:strand:- start:130 stop:528 length:399 start_codon:yes stop_codon:yes gene_type:complete
MTDLALITSALTSIKTATDFAKLINESSSSLKEAETKLKLAELISALADAKVSIADIKSELIDKDTKIDDLKRELEMKSNLIFKKPYYFQDGDQQPFCPVCWENDSKTIHLQGPENYNGETGYNCLVCKNVI